MIELLLSQAEQIMRKRINEAHMRNGVTIIDPATTYIESDIRLAKIQSFFQVR